MFSQYLRGLLFLLSLTAAASLKAGTITDHTLRCDGLQRTYKLYLPDHIAPDAPLIVVLHGYGGQADPSHHPMMDVADRFGVALCYPQGAKDGRGKSCWNAGYPFQKGLKTDDVQFITKLVAHLQRHYRLSRHNTFCTGMSNGGEMCYILAAQRPQLFAAVAPISGLMMEWLHRTDRSQTAVPLLEIHGTADIVSVWEGDLENRGGWGAYLAVPLAIQYWAAKDRCTTLEVSELPDTDGQVIVHRYGGGTAGSEVWLYECRGGSHSWHQKGIDTQQEIWKFFSRFVR